MNDNRHSQGLPHLSCAVEVWEWISNFIPHFTMDVITDPACWLSGNTRPHTALHKINDNRHSQGLPHLSCAVEVWEWIDNFIPHFTMDVITYPACWLSGNTRKQPTSTWSMITDIPRDYLTLAGCLSLGMDKQFHPTLYNGYNYLSCPLTLWKY